MAHVSPFQADAFTLHVRYSENVSAIPSNRLTRGNSYQAMQLMPQDKGSVSEEETAGKKHAFASPSPQ